MDFESVEQAARRLQVTPRSVQKWAKDGKIPGASQMGRTWLIPTDFIGPVKSADARPETEPKAAEPKAIETKAVERVGATIPVIESPSLFGAMFAPGQCVKYIESLPSGAVRDVIMAQYYHFCGQVQLAAKYAEAYLDHEDLKVALTASVVYCFANLGMGKLHLYQKGQDAIKKHMTACLRDHQDPQTRAYGVFIVNMVHVPLHIACPPVPPLESTIKYLPTGVRQYAAYLMAQEAYLEKDYARSLGMVQMALAFCEDGHVLAQIYLHLMASIDLMNLRKTVEAKIYFEKAWELAQPDGLIQIFGEHLGVLQGLLEVSLKKQYPQEYEKMVKVAAAFGDSWRKIHNADTGRTVADQLTAVEMAVAMLFQRGWAVKEIAAYMDISPRMVRHHIAVIYEKLGITHREELEQYMIL